ncbi:MAG: cytochrome P450 [Frankiaceae bacterium]|jgi:cytochrome P450|nr:cytochrome P450 [Frankiaceae bacterium]
MTATMPDALVITGEDVDKPSTRPEARERIYSTPLEKLDPGDPDNFPTGDMHLIFQRLRQEDPVHFTAEEHTELEPYWSLTKWADIQTADTTPADFSADGIIAMGRSRKETAAIEAAREAHAAANGYGLTESRSLLSLDPPDHDVHRASVSEGVSPANLRALEPIIRERAGKILDGLPIGEEFDWVDKVSIELTAMTLATLFDYPQEQRRQLTTWSNIMTTSAGDVGSPVKTMEERAAAVREFTTTFAELFKERRSAEPRMDFISLMAHSPHAQNFTQGQLFGNGTVLLVGGNDTTRNTISGSVYALHKNPAENAKLRANPALIPSMVSETIRWQTPLTHMARHTTRDVEVRGKVIPKGGKVVLWYVSGNRDEDKIQNAFDYVIDRPNPRHHLSFGFGVHRCLGNKLAELQLRLIWEEILKRFPEVVVTQEPVRSHTNFVKGYEEMKVVIPRRI